MVYTIKYRWLCLFLCLCILLCCCPVSAQAEQTPSADTSWYKEDGVFFTLENEADFLGFLTLVSRGNSFQNKSIQLSSDLSLKDMALPAAGIFSGHFDGKNHTISHLSLKGEACALFFTLTGSASVQNLVFSDVSVQGTARAAVLSLEGQEGLRISNCTLQSGTVSADKAAGFICQATGTVTLSRCENNAAVSGNAVAGGLVAEFAASAASSAAQVIACINTGAVSARQTAGGLIGQAQHFVSLSHDINCGAVSLLQSGAVGGLIGTAENAKMEDCTNSGAVSAAASSEKTWAGGLAGKFGGQAENVLNAKEGSVANASSHSQSAAGGLFGLFSQGTVRRARNLASISGPAQAGGLMGQAVSVFQNSFSFSMMENRGTVEGGLHTGGVIGLLNMQESSARSASKALWQCANLGQIKAGHYAGGLLGAVNVSERATLESLLVDCFNTGAVQSGQLAGGLIGLLPRVQTASSQAVISHSYQNGQLQAPHLGGLIGQLSAQGNIFSHCAYPNFQPVIGKGSANGAEGLSKEDLSSKALVSLLNGAEGSVWKQQEDGSVVFSFITELLAPAANIEEGGVIKHTDPLVLFSTAGSEIVYTVTATVGGKTKIAEQKRIQSGQSLSLSSYKPGTELQIEMTAHRDGVPDSAPVLLHIQLQAVQPLTITGLSLSSASREYDGTNTIALQGTPSLMGAITENDDIHLEGTPVGRFLDKDAGTGKVVSVQGIALVGADAEYYTLITPIFTADIVRKPLTLQNVSIADKGYDGTALANLSNVDLVGILPGESVSVDYLNAKAAFTSVEKGDAVPAFVTNLQLQGADSHNYSLLETNAMTTGRIVTMPEIERSNTAQSGQCTVTLEGLEAVMPSTLSPGSGGRVQLYAVANDIALPQSAQTEQGDTQTQSILAIDLQLKQAYLTGQTRQSESVLPPGMITAPLTVKLTFTPGDTKQTFALAQPNAAGELIRLETQTQINQDGTVTLTAKTQTMGELVVQGTKTAKQSGFSMSTVLPYILLLVIIVLIILAGRKTKGSKA